MRPLLVLLVLVAPGCRHRDLPPLTAALLSIGGSSSTARDTAASALADAVARVEARLRAGAAPADALNAVVFDELHFEREVKEADPRFMRLAQVLADRRGSCLGLAALYLALGERLGPAHGFAVSGVLVPGHFFVRVGERNVELLRRGEQMPDAWYREKWEVPEKDAPAYLRPLSPAEVLAVFDYNIGNDLRLQGRFVEAAVAYRRAISGFPQLAEAHASLGLVRHLTGALKEAEEAYRSAYAVNPHLPGLEKNLAVVREELRAKGR
jgi:regulator of sirC expression with transglutaminase-like and TPR domain